MTTITGVKLFLKGRKSQQINLIYLSISYLFVILFLLVTTLRLELIWDRSMNYFVYLFLALYVHKTFYKNRKSPLRYIISSISLLWGFLMFVVERNSLFSSDYYFTFVSSFLKLIATIIIFVWFILTSYNLLKTLKNQQVSPWIIFRLKLLIIVGVLMVFLMVPDFFVLGVKTNDSSVLLSFYIRSIRMILISLALFFTFIAWVLPKDVLKLIKKQYLTADPSNAVLLSEEEIFSLFSGQNERKNQD
jgi:hypothetical protein